MANKFVVLKYPMDNNLISIFPPIEFPCIVNGKRLTAKITHEEDHPTSTVYYLTFSDGYKTSFFSIEHELGFYEEGKGYSDYAKAVAGDLKCVGGFRLDKELYCIPMDESGENKNVWIKQDADMNNKYGVYTPGKEISFRFYVMRTEKNGWAAGHPHPKEILTDADNILATKVCKLIDSYPK